MTFEPGQRLVESIQLRQRMESRIGDDPAALIPRSDLVVLCMPVCACRPALHSIAPHLRPEPEEQAVLGMLRSMRGDGATYQQLVEYLNDPSLDFRVVGSSVGESKDYLGGRVAALLADTGTPDADFEIVDDYVGLGYGKTTDDELRVQMAATRLTGLIWENETKSSKLSRVR